MGMKKGAFKKSERPSGNVLAWPGYASLRNTHTRKGSFLLKQAFSLVYPVVEISGIEPLTS